MRNASAERAEYRRKLEMVPYIADIILEVRVVSEQEARRKVSHALYPLVEQAALQAGDVLSVAQKQVKDFGGVTEPTDRPDLYRFTGSVRFVSDSASWEEASAWLRQLLDGFRHEDITVLALEQYKGFYDGGF